MLLCAVRAMLQRAADHVLHPGPPPSGWLKIAAVTLGAVGIALLVMIVDGTRHDRPAKHFGEGGFGTFLSAGLLLVAGVLCGAVALDPRSRALRRFWTVAAVGFVYLVYDELGMAHENIDKVAHQALGWDHRHWLTDRLDDVLVLLYGVVAASWAFRHRARLLRLRWTTSTMALASLAFGLMVAFDLARGWQTTEEVLKIFAETLIVVALLAARREIRVLR